ncbi:helix-turn-helix domain-containing protein [Candidatus Enterococcus murrayae]|uniref:Helix-turn-helix domain-containing protein n=1 Tax=Candidatus Enterococcus murrayae TaxID=2815321 RepID=A0ABS3HBV3_9ENTE|nr:helix-turn-helix domain-containing protein [Enterococcus sp. MJM16]MBO0450931.1 helix-turn-helix domain-containing protein [Enterococcus sp. MJM16]
MFINQLLSSETQLELSLLQTLFVNRTWLTTMELQQCCKKSRNTIIKYCDLLKEDAKKITAYDLIQHENGRGYFFNGGKEDYQSMLISIVHKSLSFDLLQQLLLKKEVLLNEFANEHYTDPMTIRRMLKKFNKHTKSIELSFHIKKGIIHISGTEPAIRFFTYIFFWYIYKGTVWPFNDLSEQQISSFINHTFSKYGNVNDIITHQWSYILAINILRNSMGRKISMGMLPVFSEELVCFVFEPPSPIDGDNFMKQLNKIHDFSWEEILYFFLLLLTGVRFYTIKDIYSRILYFHQKNNSIINEKLRLIISRFPEFNQATIENQELATSLLMSSLLRSILFPNYTVPISGYDYQEYLDVNFPFLKKEMANRLKWLQREDDFFSSSQDFLLLRMVEMYTLLGDPVDFNPKIILQLETDLPITIEKLLKSYLLSLFSPFYRLSIFSTLGSDKAIIPDLIITCTKPKNQTDHGIPIVYISPNLTNNDLKELTAAFNNLIDVKMV